MTSDPRRTDIVRRAFKELLAGGAGDTGLRPADICAHLRTAGQPLGSWEVRFELSQLEASGEICLDPATATWHSATRAADKRRGTA